MSPQRPRVIDAPAYAGAERSLARLLDTRNDVLLLQGEAILLLEAAGRGLGGPGVRALNLVTGPYGHGVGDWLAQSGAEVVTVEFGFERALDLDTVQAALDGGRFDLVNVVHAESATGLVHPLAGVARAAHAAGALVLVDAVASVGAEPLPIDELGLDLVMLGLQKAPGGPNGVCALVGSERGWAQITANPAAPRGTIVSLLDWKERWIDAGRSQIPGYANEHEMRALLEMLDRHEGDIGFARVIAGHARARTATLAGVRALGLEPWVRDEAQASAVVTLVRPPQGLSVDAIVGAARAHLGPDEAGLLAPTPGPLGREAVRVNHTGVASRGQSVIAAITALGLGLSDLGLTVDLGAAVAAAAVPLWEA